MSHIRPLREFVVGVTKLLDGRPGEAEFLPLCGELLDQLVAEDDWLPDEFAADDPVRYCQYLLHCDPFERFSVVSFVWGPGQSTPIHDHRTWGAIGILRGMEESTLFDRDKATGRLTQGETRMLRQGAVDFVSPRLGDIHEVRNASDAQTSISIHVYGANIGAVKRHTFDPETGQPSDFVSGYTSERVPNLWDLSRE